VIASNIVAADTKLSPILFQVIAWKTQPQGASPRLEVLMLRYSSLPPLPRFGGKHRIQVT
jgi:hypothetical protein